LAWTLAALTVLYFVMFYFMNEVFLASIILAAAVGILNLRIFSLMHDCSHYAYFTGRRANAWVGTFLGLVVMTPFFYWKYYHLKHHGTTGDLDRRGWGDVFTYTVEEYNGLSQIERISYRIYRNPWIYLTVGPFLYVFILMRNPFSVKRGTRERRSCHLVHFVWIYIYVILFASGVDVVKVFALQLITIFVAGFIGLWLFYIQHQFETAYWRRSPDWQFYDAAWQGSSYLEVPRVVEWLVGNVNLHDVHHLDAKVPNYRLRERMQSLQQAFGSRNVLRFSASFKTFRLKLWDEEKGVMVGFPKRQAKLEQPSGR